MTGHDTHLALAVEHHDTPTEIEPTVFDAFRTADEVAQGVIDAAEGLDAPLLSLRVAPGVVDVVLDLDAERLARAVFRDEYTTQPRDGFLVVRGRVGDVRVVITSLMGGAL